MSTPLFLLLGLTLATCVIAYWSDNLGKKLGKKRVTLFGLRPRQTATLITMASSVAIMLFTFGVLIAVNGSLRGALLRYDEERAANKRLRENNKNLRDEQTSLKTQVEQAQTARSQAQNDAAKARGQVQKARADYNQAAAQLKNKQAEVRHAQSAEKTARRDEKQARFNESIARQSATQANEQLKAKQEQLQKVNGDLTGARRRLAASQASLAAAQKREVQARAAATQASRVATQAAKEFLVQTRLQQQEVSRLEAKQTELQQAVAKLDEIRHQLGSGDLEFPIRKGDTFTAHKFTARTGVLQASAKLHQMFEESKQRLAQDKRILRLAFPNGQVPPTEQVNQIIEELARGVAASRVDVSVRLTALRNYAAAENEVQAAFLAYPARRIFVRDETLAQALINGQQSDARIFNQLLQLLGTGELEARRLGVAPILEGEQKFYADDTNERVFETLRRIQAAKAPVGVRLIADEDITTLDQLSVRFEVGDGVGNLETPTEKTPAANP